MQGCICLMSICPKHKILLPKKGVSCENYTSVLNALYMFCDFSPLYQTQMIIEMLMHASEQPNGNSNPTVGAKTGKDAQTLLRVLCHKRDRDASKFLKLHYELPRSSGTYQYGIFGLFIHLLFLRYAVILMMFTNINLGFLSSDCIFDTFCFSPEYDDLPERDPSSKMPHLSGIFKRSTSIDWTLTRQGSFTALKKKFQNATSEIKNKPW